MQTVLTVSETDYQPLILNKYALTPPCKSQQWSGPSPRIKKWSGRGNHRVPTAREGESTKGGPHPHPPLVRGLGGLPQENFEFLALLCAFFTGFYAFGTRFQSRFFARDFLRVRKPNAK